MPGREHEDDMNMIAMDGVRNPKDQPADPRGRMSRLYLYMPCGEPLLMTRDPRGIRGRGP